MSEPGIFMCGYESELARTRRDLDEALDVLEMVAKLDEPDTPWKKGAKLVCRKHGRLPEKE